MSITLSGETLFLIAVASLVLATVILCAVVKLALIMSRLIEQIDEGDDWEVRMCPTADETMTAPTPVRSRSVRLNHSSEV